MGLRFLVTLFVGISVTSRADQKYLDSTTYTVIVMHSSILLC